MHSRLSPLIVRRVGPLAAALPLYEQIRIEPEQAAAWLADLKLFSTGWVAGLIVFGTFFS